MTSEEWERVESMLEGALARPAAERDAYLREACGEEEALLAEARSLLEEAEAEPSFLETPVLAVGDRSGGGEPSFDSIGAYRMVRLLGRGGMGDVYLAVHEAEDFRQDVAFKVIRRGMDTEEVLGRFRLERQILANLNHPGIAGLLDAGATPEGTPFFVMEYVDGMPIDAYCDHRRLGVRDRLELLQSVCHAVQHAHQKLVVHRDLKPSNILVTAEGAPKLLDFGIGKLLDPLEPGPADLTRADTRMLTPRYAAPEQLAGQSVSTATDVYALGILLYELLTGSHPFADRLGEAGALERAVAHDAPPTPSTVVTGGTRRGAVPDADRAVIAERRGTDAGRLRRSLAGDLDNIVLEAIRKEPERRYATAEALADDIGRHLSGLPVAARPDTFTYRAHKFVRRNAAGVAAATLVVLTLAASTVVTTVQSRRIQRESERVARERDKAVEVRGFLLEMFGASGADQAGDTLTVRQLLDRQASSLDEAYGGQPELRAEMLSVLAEGYDRLALYDQAERLAREALTARRAILGDGHPDVAASLNLLGWLLHERGRSQEAVPLLEEAIAAYRRSADPEPVGLGRALNDLGVITSALGRYDESEALAREALAIRRVHFGPEHRSVGVTGNNLATVLYRLGDYRGATEVGGVALRALRAALGPDHQRTVIVQGNLAAFQVAGGDHAGAVQQYEDLVERQSRLQGRGHPVTAHIMMSLATTLHTLGRSEEAEPLLRESVGAFEQSLGPGHPRTAEARGQLGVVLAARGQIDEAIDLGEEALARQRAAFAEPHVEIGESLARLAGLMELDGQLDEAEARYGEALANLEGALGDTHPQATRVRISFGELLLRSGRATEARDAFALSLEAAAGGDGDPGLVHGARLWLARAELELGDLPRSRDLLEESRAAVESGDAGADVQSLFDDVEARVTAASG